MESHQTSPRSFRDHCSRKERHSSVIQFFNLPVTLTQMETCMHINGVEIEKTFAEAFPMIAARVIITAATSDWAATAGRVTTGYATSIIGCDAEAGIECSLSHDQTPDGRPGISLLLFAFNQKQLEKSPIHSYNRARGYSVAMNIVWHCIRSSKYCVLSG